MTSEAAAAAGKKEKEGRKATASNNLWASRRNLTALCLFNCLCRPRLNNSKEEDTKKSERIRASFATDRSSRRQRQDIIYLALLCSALTTVCTLCRKNRELAL
jgi:hypothetical protein